MSEITATMMLKSFPMKGGDDQYSYTKNSDFQKESIDAAKVMIDEEISRKLDVKNLANSTSFRIADLGCSVGPNTFICVENLIKAVKNRYKTEGLSAQIPEFQAFFSDQVSNDFNTLFRSLPLAERPNYFAAGVPGSFHSQLFPESWLHFIHVSNALHWLSQIPEEVLDMNSPAYNKGRIFYTITAPEEVGKAYAAQFAKDMGNFLDSRAKELVTGGMVVIIGPIRPQTRFRQLGDVMFDLLGSALMDMAKEGIISEDKVDSFNVPIYSASNEEMTQIIERNGCFKIERMEHFHPKSAFNALISGKACAMHVRAAGFEEMISKHFGIEIIDELFDRFSKKTEEFSSLLQSSANASSQLFLALKRK